MGQRSIETWARPADDVEQQPREVNDALLVSSVHQHELTEQADAARDEANKSRDQAVMLAAALRESERRYRTLFNAMDEGYCIIEVLFDNQQHPPKPVDYRFIEVNGSFERQSGMHDVVGKRMLEFVPSIESHWLNNYGTVALTGEGIRFSGEYKGLNRWFDVYAFRADGWPEGHVAVLFADVTERRRAEETLQKSEERFRALFELGPVAAYSCDASGVIQQFNRRAAELWGREPALGDTDERFCGSFRMIRPDGSVMAHDQCPMADVLCGRVPHVRDAEVGIDRLDGSRVTVVVNIRPLKNEQGKITGAINCFYDITERKEMEQRLRKSEEQIRQQAELLADESRRKDEFLAMLSHELRNPLAPIRSAVNLLKLQENGSENLIQKQAHDIIERQVASLTKLVSDLLEVSRVISGRIRLNLQTVDLNQVIQHAIETATPLVENRKHELALKLCSDAVWVNADATRIEEVFVNLLNNAAKYTDKGGRIEVWCERVGGENDVQVRIRDNGVGIDEKLLPRVFDLFTQADRSLDRAAGGLGIGLCLAHRIIELHGGGIEAQSPPAGSDRGSEFIVRLPVAAAPDFTPAPVQGEAPQKPDGLRVLVVDDNIDLVLMLVGSLRNKGYNVQTAHTGPEGLKIAQQWRPNVVLLDIGLPELDGYEVARRLRSDETLGSARTEMRIVALTGYGQATDVALAREAGFDAHMTKPCDFRDLEKLIHAPRSQRATTGAPT